MPGSARRVLLGLCLGTALAVVTPAAALAGTPSDVWDAVAGTPAASHNGAPAEVQPDRFRAFTLDGASLKSGLAGAPKAGLRSRSLAPTASVVLSVPAPSGGFQRFAVHESTIMEPGLAAKHPDIKTYAGRGIDDPAATIAADTGPLGFHASVRSPGGSWYVDPYYHLDQSVYVSYYGRDLVDDPHGLFGERGPEGTSDPLGVGTQAAALGPEIKLRTYRLALLTDPTYATYFGGNTTAAKVTLMNRVDQIYEDETAIRMVLIADNDKLNLDTAGQMTGANGPCGAAACFTPAQSTSCGSSTLTRNRVVIGQLVGASNFDIGHIALGNPGGGIASLQAVGGNNKAQGCTGLSTPVGDFFAVDYVAHEMGHQFNGNHTFNGTQSNCSGGNRNATTSVEPGSGSSIMTYAGICAQDNLQPHSDPYWSQRSYDEISAYTSSTRPAINEAQTVSLRDFDGADSLRPTYDGRTAPAFVRGTDYTLADLQGRLQGSEVQAVRLSGHDTNGESYTLDWRGADSVPITRGQNDTNPGVLNAIRGGNEQQQVTLAGFTAATQSFQIQIGGNTSAVLGQGGLAVNNNNVAAAVNAIAGFAGTVTSAGAGNAGFTLTFGGPSANSDVPAISIVNCTGTCVATVRETAKGGTGIAGWPAAATVTVGPVTDAGYTLNFGGPFQFVDVDPFSVTNGSGVTGAVVETTRAGAGILPAGATATVLGWGAATALDDTGFQVTFGGTLAGQNLAPLGLDVTGGSAFVGETAKGGPIDNQGFIVTNTGNHAPTVTTAPGFTIPVRTPFSLTGSATDDDNDPITYMWEQNDRGGTAGTALVNNVKTNGPLFRQFGTFADVSPAGTLLTPSPGLNAVTSDPTRTFPDLAQIAAGNTNAVTGLCPAAPAAPAAVPALSRDCFSEFLPTADWVGFLGDRTMTFRLTARDYHPGGGGIGSAETKLTVEKLAGPFLVTSHSVPATMYGASPQTVTWDVAGTASPPVSATDVKISLSADGGMTFPYVLAASTPNDGSASVVLPLVTATKARIKVEAVGNVFFDISDTDLAIAAPPTSTIGGTVPPMLALTVGGAATFDAFMPGLAKDYDTTVGANVVSTAGDAALSVTDPSSTAPGRLVNGAFALPSALQVKAGTGNLVTVGGTPATLSTYSAPVSHDAVTLGFRQHIGATDALRTGAYSKTLTFTLSTTTP